MKPEIKSLWVAALRSGKYEQGKGMLAAQDSPAEPVQYCCLGVLCDVMEMNYRLVESTFKRGRMVRVYEFAGQEERTALPSIFAHSVGLTSCDPQIQIENREGVVLRRYLSEFNDTLDLTFDQIADLIEYFF